MARKKVKIPDMGDATVPISSMIDVVFLLIIFFVVTAAIDKEIDDEKVVLSMAPHGKPVTKKDPRSVIINVRSDGTMTMGMHIVSPKDLSGILNNAAAKWGTDLPIIIRGDEDVQHEYIKRVMKAVTDTKLYKVKFNAIVNQ